MRFNNNKQPFIWPFRLVILGLFLPSYLSAQQIDSGTVTLIKNRIIELESTGYPCLTVYKRCCDQ
jgi:hypothetical protein